MSIVQASASRIISDFSEVKLKCVICMEAMKEETSTMCGHIFCRVCITNAIRAQKKCPTCREKLTISSIHRIYLPGATSWQSWTPKHTTPGFVSLVSCNPSSSDFRLTESSWRRLSYLPRIMFLYYFFLFLPLWYKVIWM